MTINFRSALWAALFAMASLHSTPSYAVWESTKIHLCNKTDVDMTVGQVNNHFYQGVEYWEESGWYILKKNRCEYFAELKTGKLVGFAFRAEVGDKTIYPEFTPKNTRGGESVGVPDMCVHPNNKFHYTQKKKHEIGVRCKTPNSTIPLSFFYGAHWNDDQNTVIKTSLRGTFLPENPNQVTGLPVLKSHDEAGRREFAEHLDHKFVLKAFSIWQKDSSFYDFEKVYIDKVTIAGKAEHAVIYAIMRDHRIGERLIGEGKQFADYYAYLGGMFHNFSMDYQFDEVILTELGHEQIGVFAKMYNLVNDAEKIKQNYIDKGWK